MAGYQSSSFFIEFMDWDGVKVYKRVKKNEANIQLSWLNISMVNKGFIAAQWA